MLTIRANQMEAFDRALVARFAEGLRLFLLEQRVKTRDLPPDELMRFISRAIDAARQRDFVVRRHIIVFTVLSLDYGLDEVIRAADAVLPVAAADRGIDGLERLKELAAELVRLHGVKEA